MLHARQDYQHIQDLSGKIAIDEPVFLLRAHDACAPMTVLKWAELAELLGVDADMIKAAKKHAEAMFDWQQKNGMKFPDMPKNNS